MQIMKRYSLFIAIAVVLVSCRKEDASEFEGPSIDDLNSPLTIVSGLSSSSDLVDFAAGESVYFTAEMSKSINWQLRIIGLESGAEKIVEGFSETIGATEYVWDGSTTNFPVFRNEACLVELTFENESDTLTDSLVIATPKTNEGFLVADFDSGFNPGWTSFIQSGLNMDFQVTNDGSAAEGDAHFNMAGTVDWDYLIGLVNFNANAYNGDIHFPLSSNPNDVYFNAMIYGDPTLKNSIVLFQFEEDENSNEIFDPASEDMYSYELPITWTGWQLVSVRYSDMINPDAAGNGVHDPHRIKQINMLHLANPDFGFASSKLDYLIFTENGPLKP
jgi:hypothetical protein